MTRLYKKKGNETTFWWIWENNRGNAIYSQGIVGQEAKEQEIKIGFFSNYKKKTDPLIREKLADGYKEYQKDQFRSFIIEYDSNKFDANHDDEDTSLIWFEFLIFFGERGIGFAEKNEINGDIIHVICYVLDVDLAKSLLDDFYQDNYLGRYQKIIS